MKGSDGEYGSRVCTDYLDAILPGLLDLLGGEDIEYGSIADVADHSLSTLIANAYQDGIDAGLYPEDSQQYRDLIYYRDILSNNVTTLRRAVSYLLFYDDGKAVWLEDSRERDAGLASRLKPFCPAGRERYFLIFQRKVFGKH